LSIYHPFALFLDECAQSHLSTGQNETQDPKQHHQGQLARACFDLQIHPIQTKTIGLRRTYSHKIKIRQAQESPNIDGTESSDMERNES
jgi:hypothetical protein